MTYTDNHSEDVLGSQEVFEQMVKERLRHAVRAALVTILEEEVTAFIGAKPYERNEERRDHRNGYYQRDLETTVGQISDLPIPRTRRGHQTQVFERYHRRRDELDGAIGEMFVRMSQYCQSGRSDRDADRLPSQCLNRLARLSQLRSRI